MLVKRDSEHVFAKWQIPTEVLKSGEALRVEMESAETDLAGSGRDQSCYHTSLERVLTLRLAVRMMAACDAESLISVATLHCEMVE